MSTLSRAVKEYAEAANKNDSKVFIPILISQQTGHKCAGTSSL
jgi:hypothetical protein